MPLAAITHRGKTFRFRTNPNSIRWNYTLNTKIEETYGGRVVQILSANMDDLVVTADSGGGGWDYMYSAALFFRDMLFDQRSGGEPGTFSYPTRGWEMNVYAVNFPFKDAWNEVKREFTMQFKIQEDVNGVITSDTVSSEIERLRQGLGYEHNDFNTPPGDPGSTAWPSYTDPVTGTTDDPAASTNPAVPPVGSNGIPGSPTTSAPGGNLGIPGIPTIPVP